MSPSLLVATLAVSVGQVSPGFEVEPVVTSSASPRRRADDPEAEDREHRPLDPEERTRQGTNERLIEDLAAAHGEISLPELLDEILADVVAEIAERPAQWVSPLAVRTVRLGANVEPGFGRRIVAALVTSIHAGTDVRVVECLECQLTRTEVVDGRWVVRRGLTTNAESRRVAAQIGAKSFLDLSFGFEPETDQVQLDVQIVRAEDAVVLWSDTFRADSTTPMLMRSSFAPQRRKDRLRDLEMLLEGRPMYGYAANAGFMLLPYDDPVAGDIGGATAGFRLYERFGEDRQVMFGLDMMGFLNTERLAGGLFSAGMWWVFPRPDLVNPELRLGAKAGAFVAGSAGNAAVFQLGAEVLLRYRFGLYGYLLFMTESELEPGRFLGGLGFSAGMSFNW